ncbi:hypothetical protein FRB91_000998 [Serendipita sp. 411]|nr:hypothetical protein FRB91_000998 [Serendipita sp. 411]
MEVSKGADPTNRTAAIATVSNLAFAIASPARASPIYQRISSGIVKPRPNNDSDVSLDLTIAGLETLKQASEVIPVAGVGLKVTCGIMILILHVVKRCKANRAGWEKLAEVIRKKNESITMLLELYSKSPAGYPSAERHANEYQRVLNSVAEDIKKETQREAEASQGLERYWSRTWTTGRDAVLANINAEKIASYQEQIQSITFDVIEKTVVHQALANAQAFDDIKAILTERPRSKAPTVILKPRPRIVEDFVGRNDILTSMCKTHFIKGESPSRRDGPVITVLTGMGGSGKTQIAVKFASLFEEQ